MKRIFISAILIATIMVGGTGCMFNSKPERDVFNNEPEQDVFNSKPEQDVNELALEFLEQKYGEKFEYSAPAGASYTGTRTFLAKCESLGDKTVVVQIDNYKSDERQYRDNYFEIKYADQLSDYLSQIVNDQFGESKLYYAPAGKALSANLPADATFDDYLMDSSGTINAMVVVKKSDYNDIDQVSQIMETISSNCAADSISLVVLVIDDSKYIDCNLSKARDYNIRGIYFAKGEIFRVDGDTSIDYYNG